MKGRLTYLLLALLLGTALGGCQGDRRMPSLRETYSRKDKNPFGTYIAHKQVEAMYAANSIRDKKQSFAKTWKAIQDTGALYICITPALFVNESEAESMIQFVNEGNDLFIAAAYIDEVLEKKINCRVNTDMRFLTGLGQLKTTTTSSLITPDTGYAYYYYPFSSYFKEIDTGRTRVVGVNENGKPNSIVYFYGRGKLFLHCDPRAFSNYFLLKDSNYKYLQQCLAFTGVFPEHVYWDDYYNKLRGRNNDDNERSFSTFSEIMKHPPLVYAFWISLLLLLMYVLFGGKRVQRIIEQRKPNENTTVTFTETIGRLYLQKKDNKNIADKMVTYFNEYIRNKYFLNTNLINDDFITVLSRKSGVQHEKVDALFRAITASQQSEDIDDYQLLSLNEQIQHFHKNTN